MFILRIIPVRTSTWKIGKVAEDYRNKEIDTNSIEEKTHRGLQI